MTREVATLNQNQSLLLAEELMRLRRFRHLFRAAYGIELDPERMELVLRKALALRETFPRQVEEFLAFLRSLEA